MEAVEVGERKTRDRVLNKACSHWTTVTNMTNQSNSANYTNTANSPVILVASNSPLSSSSSSATSSLKPRPCSPHVVSPVSSSLSPLSLHSHFSCLLSIPPPPLPFSLFSLFFSPLGLCTWRCELGGILDKVFHILLATMSKFDSPQIDSVIDDDDEFW